MSEEQQVTNPEPIHIEQRGECEYQVHNLSRGEGVWIQVENFDVKLRRTDTGLIVDVYDFDSIDKLEPLKSLEVDDELTASFRPEEE